MSDEGKTKILWPTDDPDVIRVQNKDDITAHDDPRLTKTFGSKARCATATTCRVFELLNACGVPTSYLSQVDETHFLAHRTTMIELEVIIRRGVFDKSSYTKRNPQLSARELPMWFHRLAFELFLKTKDQQWRDRPLPGVDDPYIVNPYEEEWQLSFPKKPIWESQDGMFMVKRSDVLPDNVTVEQIEELARRIFLILEKAWAVLGLKLIDFKIEFGITADGRLVVSDVIDGDSWRLWQEKMQLDKQLFRDGADLALVEEKYLFVANLAKMLKLPKQALVLWRGSASDPLFPVPEIPGIAVEEVVCSMHKKTATGLSRLEQITQTYPQGGAIIVLVGRSNGAGPVIKAHTEWPVFSVPMTLKESPEDLWSSVRMPSNVGNATVWPESNALEAALDVLAMTNPAAYAFRRSVIEAQDDYTS